MINTFLLIFLTIASPNIAMEQYEYALLNNTITGKVDLENGLVANVNIANPEDLENAKQEDREKWDSAITEDNEGKMFKQVCNSIGECEYMWVEPHDLLYNVTSNWGEVRQIAIYCDDGTFANYETLECELTEEQKKINQQIMLFFIALGIFIGLVAVWFYLKIRKEKRDVQ